MHGCPGQPKSPVFGDELRGGLLQRVIGEQPVRRVVELGFGAAPQQHRLDQHRCPVAESCSYRGDVGNPRGVAQLIAIDVVERLRSRLTAQIADGVDVEIYDGLTPVTMTL